VIVVIAEPGSTPDTSILLRDTRAFLLGFVAEPDVPVARFPSVFRNGTRIHHSLFRKIPRLFAFRGLRGILTA